MGLKYKVYKIFFKNKNAIYVGCTNNMRRRKDQHNENIKKNKSAFARFFNEHNLKTFEMEMIAEFNNRHDALVYEKKITIKLDLENKYTVINDNYTSHCTRKGKNFGNTSKKWVIINLNTKKIDITEISLRQYAIQNGLNYKNMHHCGTHKSHICHEYYKVFKLDEWKTLKDLEKQYYISGEFLKDINKSNMQKHIKRCSKKYEVTKPDGSSIVIENLAKFARENNLNAGNLQHGKKSKGFVAKKID